MQQNRGADILLPAQRTGTKAIIPNRRSPHVQAAAWQTDTPMLSTLGVTDDSTA